MGHGSAGSVPRQCELQCVRALCALVLLQGSLSGERSLLDTRGEAAAGWRGRRPAGAWTRLTLPHAVTGLYLPY